MGTPVNFIETELGFQCEFEGHLLFFGKAQANLEALYKQFPDLQFYRARQTHSDRVQEITETHIATHEWSKLPEADGLICKTFPLKTKMALVMSTADCIPVLLIDPVNKSFGAVHAGWRGIENLILRNYLSLSGESPRNQWAFIGPHIQQKSFQIGTEVKDALIAALQAVQQKLPIEKLVQQEPADSAQQCHFDLNLAVQLQLKGLGLPGEQVHSINLDTFADSRFHSYRRDKTPMRQLSFCAQLG